ncbi:MAG: NAD(P)-dependent oxidoreductase [Gemmatimonadota bacterium]
MISGEGSPDALGLIGLGSMGAPMARALLQAGFALRVYNRSPGPADELVAHGAVIAPRPADAVPGPSRVVVSMVSDDRALEAVTLGEGGILQALGAGGVHLSMSTVAPETARRLAAEHAGRGAAYLSAPVFGRPEAAAARSLWVCISGEGAARRRVQPVLRGLGQGGFDVGEDPAAACVVKLAGNFLIAAAIEALGEACALVEKNGIEPATFVEAMGTTLFACPIYQSYGRTIVEQSYDPAGFKLSLGLKDAGLIRGAALWSGVRMPLAELLQERFRDAAEKGRSELDWSVVALSAAEEAGLRGETPQV